MSKLDEKKKIKYGVKTLDLKIEDIDEKNRIVKGYFASFNTIDSDDDVIRPGAFTKSILENGPNAPGNRKIAHLRNHDWDRQIGNILELEEDEFGLKFVSKLGESTQGNDALLDYEAEILREHSIGFNYIWDKVKYIEDSPFSENGHFDIFEVKLWEGSGVTFGANSLTPVIDAAKNSGDNTELLDRIAKLEESFTKALKNGKGTDERLETIEIRFKQIQQLRNSLTTEEPFNKDTLKINKPNEATTTFYQSLLK